MALTEVNTQGIKNASIKLEDIENGTSSDNGKFLKNNDGAAPSWTTVSTDLLSDTSPQLGGDLATNGNEILVADGDEVRFGSDIDLIIKESSSNGYITARSGGTIYLGASGATNILNVNGTEVNIQGETKLANGNDLQVTGSGNIIIEEHPTDATNGSLRFRERAANGSAYVGIKGPLDMGSASSYTLTLPTGTPTTGQVLKSSSTATTLEWGEAGAGATGGGTNKIFWENGQTIDYSYTITDNHNAMTAGPVTIAATGNGNGSAVVVIVGDGETWTIV